MCIRDRTNATRIRNPNATGPSPTNAGENERLECAVAGCNKPVARSQDAGNTFISCGRRVHMLCFRRHFTQSTSTDDLHCSVACGATPKVVPAMVLSNDDTPNEEKSGATPIVSLDDDGHDQVTAVVTESQGQVVVVPPRTDPVRSTNAATDETTAAAADAATHGDSVPHGSRTATTNETAETVVQRAPAPEQTLAAVFAIPVEQIGGASTAPNVRGDTLAKSTQVIQTIFQRLDDICDTTLALPNTHRAINDEFLNLQQDLIRTKSRLYDLQAKMSDMQDNDNIDGNDDNEDGQE